MHRWIRKQCIFILMLTKPFLNRNLAENTPFVLGSYVAGNRNITKMGFIHYVYLTDLADPWVLDDKWDM